MTSVRLLIPLFFIVGGTPRIGNVSTTGLKILYRIIVSTLYPTGDFFINLSGKVDTVTAFLSSPSPLSKGRAQQKKDPALLQDP